MVDSSELKWSGELSVKAQIALTNRMKKIGITKPSIEGVYAALSHLPLKSFGRLNHHNAEVIVSLTAVPWRLDKIHVVLTSLLCQSIKPDKIVLWLSEHDRTGKRVVCRDSLPANVTRMKRKGVMIKFVDDILSYRKLIPALEEYPDATIVTADDDTLYPPNWLSRLIDTAERNPGNIVCYRGTRMLMSNNQLLPYASWPEFSMRDRPSFLLFAQGGEGALYPAGALHPEVTNRDVFMRISPTADDVWFKAMAVHNGVKHVKISERHEDLSRIRGSQAEGETLHYINNTLGRNDQQIAAVFSRYSILKVFERSLDE